MERSPHHEIEARDKDDAPRREVRAKCPPRDERHAEARRDRAEDRLVAPQLDVHRERLLAHVRVAKRAIEHRARPRAGLAVEHRKLRQVGDGAQARAAVGRDDGDHLVVDERLEAHARRARMPFDETEGRAGACNSREHRLGVSNVENDRHVGMARAERREHAGENVGRNRGARRQRQRPERLAFGRKGRCRLVEESLDGPRIARLPWVSSGVALLAGVTVGLALGNPFAKTTRALAHKMLALSVVGLGAGMDLRVVARVGLEGAFATAVGIATCIALGAFFTRILRVGTNTGALITLGTAICGGSAIAAVAPTLRPKDDEVTVALATVFLLNGVALFAFPAIGHAVGLDETRFGLWAAMAIHDTSSVVGAAMAYGPKALEVATSVKLARALWIVPVTIAVGMAIARRDLRVQSASSPEQHGVSKTTTPKPYFILGFLLAAALVTFAPALRPVGHVVSSVARQAMSVTLYLIGAGLTRPALRAVGARPLALGVLLWVVMASLSLAAVMAGLLEKGLISVP